MRTDNPQKEEKIQTLTAQKSEDLSSCIGHNFCLFTFCTNICKRTFGLSETRGDCVLMKDQVKRLRPLFISKMHFKKIVRLQQKSKSISIKVTLSKIEQNQCEIAFPSKCI